MSDDTVSVMLNIDSTFRREPLASGSEIDIVLPDEIRDVLEIHVEDVTLPPTFRNISAELGNNAFAVRDAATVRVVRLPDGLYTDAPDAAGGRAVDIERAINDAMRSAGLSERLAFTIDPATRRATFGTRDGFAAADTAHFTLFFNVDAQTTGPVLDEAPASGGLRTKLGWALGFRAGVQHAVRNATVGNGANASAVISDAACYLPIARYFHVVVDDNLSGGVGNLVAPFDGSLHARATLARAKLDDASRSKYEVHSAHRRYHRSATLRRLRLWISDELGRPVDFHGADWSVLLGLRCRAPI